MARLIINKHFAEHNEAANGFSNVDGNEDYVFGEIIICNDKENPSIYIKDIANNSIGIGNVRIVDNDKILSKTDGGKLQTSIKMAWDGVNNQIKLFGTDEETPISTIDANNIIETIDRTIEVTAVKFGYEDVPNGLTANQDYIKITSFIDNKKNIQYLPYVKEENEISISGDGIVVVSKDMDGVKISHSTVDVVYPEETELGFGNGQYISGVNVNKFGHVTEIKTATLPIPNTTLEKVIDKENGIDAQEGYYVYDVKPDGAGLKYKVEYAQLPSTVIYDEDITPEQKEKTGTFISEIKVEGDVVSYKKSDVNLDNYYTKAEAEKAFIDSSELDQKLKNMGLTEDGKLPEIAITINKDEVGDGKYISDIEVSTIDKTHLTLKTTSLGLDKFIDKESVVSNNAELSWGETTTIAAIGNKELKVSLPSKPGVIIGVSEENTTDSTYVLVGVNESAEETNEIVFEKMDFDINSVLTTKHVETKDNTLSWGTAVSVATVGDKDIKVKLPDTVISINPTEEKKGVSVITNISVDENDPTQLNVNYEDLIPKDVVTTEDLNGYATEDFVTGQGYLVSEDLNGYATEEFVTGQGYLKSSDLNGYATQNWVTNTALADNATKTWVEEQDYLTEVPSGYLKSGDLNGYATQTWVTNTALADNATQTWVEEQNYLTEVPSGYVKTEDLNGYLKSGDLNGYATQEWVEDQNYLTEVPSGYVKTEDLEAYVQDGELNTALEPYITDEELNNKGYLVESDLNGYVKEGELNNKFAEKEHNHVSSEITDSIDTKSKITATATELVQGKAVYDFVIGQDYLKSEDLNGYAKESWVSEQIANAVIGGVIDLSGYATTEYVNKTFIKNGDLDNYASKTWVEEQDYLTEVPSEYITETELNTYNFLKAGDLNSYATQTWVEGKGYTTQTWVETQGYLTKVPSGYVKSEDLNGYLKSGDLNGYATQTWVEEQDYLTEVPSGYVKAEDLNGYLKSSDLNGYATQGWVETQGYLTEVPSGYVKSEDLNGYAKESWVSEQIANAVIGGVIDLSGYATTEYVNKTFIKNGDLDNYATKTWVTNTALADNATQTWVKNQGYLTQTSLNGYVKSSDIEGKFANKTHGHVSSEITDSISDKSKVTATASELVQGKAVYDFVTGQGYLKSGDLNGYATQNWVTNTALTNYATKNFVTGQGYLKSDALNGYVKSSDIEGKFANKTHDHVSSEITDSIDNKTGITTTASELVQGKAVYDFVTGQGYLKSSDLNGYATQNWVTGTALADNATQTWVKNQGYLTQTSLNGYIKSSDIEGKFANKTHDHVSSEITDSINNKTGITTTAVQLTQGKAVYDFVDDKLSGYIKKGEETKYTLPKAEENALGGIKTGYSSNDKNYAVEVDANGNAYVNVPWVEVKNYLPNNETVPSNLHYDPTATTNTYTADSGKYISGIKYDDKHHVTGINQSTLPETKYESSTFITIKDKVVSANTGDTSSTLARGDHNHSGVYQPVGEYVETNDLKTLTFNAGAFTATTFKANADSTVKIPTSTSHLANDSNWITSSDISITVQGTNGLTGGGTIGNGGTATISHAENNLTTGSSSTTLKHGDTFNVDYPTIDSYGHVTKLSTINYTLPNVTAESLGLGAALKYCGITTTVLTDGATTNPIVINSANHTAEAGCVVFYDDKEFVFNGANWELLGAETTYKVVQSAVSSPSASGNAAAFIDTISQDANGVITATKKNVRSATTGNTGVVSLVIGDMKDKAHADGQAPSLNHTHSQYTNQNAFSNVVVSSTTISANSPTDTLTLVAGENVTITPDATNDKITIAATKYTLPTATTAVTGGVKLVAGDMNGEEHVDGQAPSLNHTHSQYLPLSGGTLTGNLRLKDSGNYGMKLNFGDGEYVYLHEMPDDSLEISAANAVTLYTEYGSLCIGEEEGGASFSCSVHASAYYQDSDERLKTFGDDIEIDFDKLKSIPKKYFTWNDDRKEGVDLGTSAQAVKELYPEIVSGDKTLSVDYAKLSIIALKAVDKLHEENEMLRTELAMIKKHLGL